MTDQIHNLDIDTAAAEWIAAKEAERKLVERRRKLENHIMQLLKIPEGLEGTSSTDTDGGHSVKVVGRMTRKVDADLIQEIAAEQGIAEHLGRLFRWKPEINVAAWSATDPAITTPLLGGITTKPGRASFSITKV